MPNYTPNLNLVKPLGTEYYDIAIFNDNSDIIDSWVIQNAQDIATHVNNNDIHVNADLKEKIDLAYNIALDTQIEFRAFKAAITDGFTGNQFSDGLNTLDAFNVYEGYYNQSLSRLEV